MSVPPVPKNVVGTLDLRLQWAFLRALGIPSAAISSSGSTRLPWSSRSAASLSMSTRTFRSLSTGRSPARRACQHHGGGTARPFFWERWVAIYRRPARLRVDPEGAWKGKELQPQLAAHNIELDVHAGQASWQLGITEMAITITLRPVRRRWRGCARTSRLSSPCP